MTSEKGLEKLRKLHERKNQRFKENERRGVNNTSQYGGNGGKKTYYKEGGYQNQNQKEQAQGYKKR